MNTSIYIGWGKKFTQVICFKEGTVVCSGVSQTVSLTWEICDLFGDFVKMQILIQDIGVGTKICISYRLLGDPDTSGPHLNFTGKEASVQTFSFLSSDIFLQKPQQTKNST